MGRHADLVGEVWALAYQDLQKLLSKLMQENIELSKIYICPYQPFKASDSQAIFPAQSNVTSKIVYFLAVSHSVDHFRDSRFSVSKYITKHSFSFSFVQ